MAREYNFPLLHSCGCDKAKTVMDGCARLLLSTQGSSQRSRQRWVRAIARLGPAPVDNYVAIYTKPSGVREVSSPKAPSISGFKKL